MSNSSTGGYLVPSSSAPLPGGLTLTQFIQTVIVGITGIDKTLVRPKWQPDPPPRPDITVDWVAFGINIDTGDANAYVQPPQGVNPNSVLQRYENLEVECSFYGPAALENISIFRDGFQIQQNLEAMQLANMGYRGIERALQTTDLWNERWYNRFDTTLTLTRQVQRVYPVLSFASANGVIHTEVDGVVKNIPWKAEGP